MHKLLDLSSYIFEELNDEFDNSKDCLDIKVVDYKHMGPIRFPLAQ